MPQGLNYGRPSGTCKEIPALRILSANACFHQLTGKIRVTCHSGALRMHRCWAHEDVQEGSEKNPLKHRLDGGRCVGRICSNYLKFSTRTMSLLNASSCV